MQNLPAQVKICGTTNRNDLLLAAAQGADFVGIITHFSPSPRNVSLETALELREAAREVGVSFVLLTVNLSLEELRQLRLQLEPDVLQLHGDETPEIVAALKAEGATVWTAVHDAERARALVASGADALLVDARATSGNQIIYGGTGQISNWSLARELAESGARVVLAGGLTPGNVAQAIESVRPWAVDAVSGVEARKGIKDKDKVAQFIAAARRAQA